MTMSKEDAVRMIRALVDEATALDKQAKAVDRAAARRLGLVLAMTKQGRDLRLRSKKLWDAVFGLSEVYGITSFEEPDAEAVRTQ